MKPIVLIGIIAVVAVVAVGAVYALTGGSDDVREDLEVGDYIKYETVDDLGHVLNVESFTVEKINSNGTLDILEKDGLEISYEYGESKRDFLDELYEEPRDLKEDGYEMVRTETIDTPFGKVKCDVYVLTLPFVTETVYLGTGSNILYMSVTGLGDNTVTTTLYTSLIG